MGVIHNENILKACRELNAGESYVFTFNSEKTSHNEYCYFRTALRSITQKLPAAKSLTLSRSGNTVTITMGIPEILYPKPTLIRAPQPIAETSLNDLSCTQSSNQYIIERIKQDLADGLISKEEADSAINDMIGEEK